MAHYGLEPQSIVTYELLVGTDGEEKMSKSLGNYVGIDEAPEEQFGKTMSIPDERSTSGSGWGSIAIRPRAPSRWRRSSRSRGHRRALPRLRGGRGGGEALHARRARGQAPEEVPDVALPDGDPVHLPALLANVFGLSTSEASRLIAQGGVKLDGAPVSDLDVPRATLAGAVLQAGKRRFMRLRG